MNDIIKKLGDAGVSSDIISTLQSKLGAELKTELMQNGLKATATKLGIDTSKLPDIDFKDLGEAFQELTGKDVDGDGKTGIGEAIENVEEAISRSNVSGKTPFPQKQEGFLAKLLAFFR
jgi:hypothetical protein